MKKTTKTKTTKVPTNIKRNQKNAPQSWKIAELTILQMLLHGKDHKYDMGDSRVKRSKKLIDRNRGILKRINIDDLNQQLGYKINERTLSRYIGEIGKILDDPDSDYIRKVTDVQTTVWGKEETNQIELCLRMTMCPEDIYDIKKQKQQKLLREFCILDYLFDNKNNIDGYELTKAYKLFYKYNNHITYKRDLDNVRYVLDEVFNISI